MLQNAASMTCGGVFVCQQLLGTCCIKRLTTVCVCACDTMSVRMFLLMTPSTEAFLELRTRCLTRTLVSLPVYTTSPKM